jgi:pyrimidine operon attenuation protein/uracil phosphoribosyltransferase
LPDIRFRPSFGPSAHVSKTMILGTPLHRNYKTSPAPLYSKDSFVSSDGRIGADIGRFCDLSGALLISSSRIIMSETTETGKPKIREKGRLMSASEIERTLVRLAHEIVEKNDGGANLGLVGIKRRGVPLAKRIGDLIAKIEKHPVDTGVLDISFYRDDLTTDGPRPTVTSGAIGFDVTGRDIILMDDVLYTGRTIRAALDALFDHGRPKSVQLLVLIDRGHRELPIEATFVGRSIPTSSREIIEVKLNEVDGQEQVLLVELVD